MTIALFADFHPLLAIAVTPQGVQVLLPLIQTMGGKLLVPSVLAQDLGLTDQVEIYDGSLAAALTDRWHHHKALIFSLATGAVVRLIAPLLDSKQTDPAVVLVDGLGESVISLLGGHQGGADLLSQLVAEQVGGQAILTGGANGLGQIAVDQLGHPFGWRRGPGDWTGVSAALAKQQLIAVHQEKGSTLWRDHLPEDH
ncbi:MAG: cobalamin biosynthesis central domain-containing protein [Synechocystis sp.]